MFSVISFDRFTNSSVYCGVTIGMSISTTQTTTADPTTVSKTFTNTKELNLHDSFVSNKIVGPDRFRLVKDVSTSIEEDRILMEDKALAMGCMLGGSVLLNTKQLVVTTAWL
jgi:hypothetical protein